MADLSDVGEYFRLRDADRLPLLDTRSSGEYAAGHLVGAHSLPLFSDEERARVGTTYKRVDPREALLLGLEIVGPKMRALVERAAELTGASFGTGEAPRVAVGCWRGGSRSASVAWLLETAGFAVLRLRGGYKAYRAHAREFLETARFDWRVIDGSTGSGKTVLLHSLRERGAQVLDLEGIARHKGSAFGLTPGDAQPTSEHAENMIFDVMRRFDPARPVWVENESRNVGHVFLPDAVVRNLAGGHRVEIVVPAEDRVAHIVEQYGAYKASVLADTVHRIRKRLGGLRSQQAIAAVDAGDLATAARIALDYYDKAYAHYSARQAHPTAERHELRFDELDDLASRLSSAHVEP